MTQYGLNSAEHVVYEANTHGAASASALARCALPVEQGSYSYVSRVDVSIVVGPRVAAPLAPTEAPVAQLVRDAGALIAHFASKPADERADEILDALFRQHSPAARPFRRLERKR